MNIRTTRTFCSLLLLPAALQLAACAGPTYYAQAIGEEMEEMGSEYIFLTPYRQAIGSQRKCTLTPFLPFPNTPQVQ